MATRPGRTRAIVTILVAVALVGLVAIGPLLALPALIALLVYMARHADDLDGAKHSRALWLGLPIAGGALFLAGIIADSLGAGDSSWWPLAVGPLIIGGPLLVIALVLNACHEVGVRFGHRPALVPSRVQGRVSRDRRGVSDARPRGDRRGARVGDLHDHDPVADHARSARVSTRCFSTSCARGRATV